MKYRIDLTARQHGAIGQLNAERRTYFVDAHDTQSAGDRAMKTAIERDSLEHVRISRVISVGRSVVHSRNSL